MTSDGQSIERLRGYLRALNPEARSLLVQELERNLLRDDENAGNELVLQELRRAIRAESQPVPRIGNAARLFFVPLEPFLIDGPADHRRVGRIARASLDPIWAWLGRDLIPAEAKALSEDIDRALLADDRTKADQLVGALHDCAVARLKEAVAGIGADDKANRRLAIQVGTRRAIDDVNTILGILSLREALAEVGRRLPNLVRIFERDQAVSTKALLDSIAAQSSLGSVGGRKSDFFLFSLILLTNRLAAPWQIIRIAARAAESDATARIAETPYAAAVTIVLGELENTVSELRAEFKAGRPIALMLKGIHDAARGLRSEMDLSVDSAWSRQLTAIRADISGLLKTEIDSTPGLVRRLLRPRPAKEIAPGALLDVKDIDEAEMRVEFVDTCRHYAGELAVSEVTARSYSELTLYLETGTKVLLDSLRVAGDADRPFRQSQVEAAIRFCRIVFGGEYSGLLTKAAEVAVHTAGIERKPMRA
jgi:hypothetical protein